VLIPLHQILLKLPKNDEISKRKLDFTHRNRCCNLAEISSRTFFSLYLPEAPHEAGFCALHPNESGLSSAASEVLLFSKMNLNYKEIYGVSSSKVSSEYL